MGKIYAVRKGRKPGLYHSWEDCKAQVHGYSGAEYKSFGDEKVPQIIFKKAEVLSVKASMPKKMPTIIF